jgi:hypothetical protein
MRNITVLVAILVIACGCTKKSALGESCAKSADCESQLKCIDQVCKGADGAKAPAPGPSASADPKGFPVKWTMTSKDVENLNIAGLKCHDAGIAFDITKPECWMECCVNERNCKSWMKGPSIELLPGVSGPTQITTTRMKGADCRSERVLTAGKVVDITVWSPFEEKSDKSKAWFVSTEKVLRQRFGKPQKEDKLDDGSRQLEWSSPTVKITLDSEHLIVEKPGK